MRVQARVAGCARRALSVLLSADHHAICLPGEGSRMREVSNMGMQNSGEEWLEHGHAFTIAFSDDSVTRRRRRVRGGRVQAAGRVFRCACPKLPPAGGPQVCGAIKGLGLYSTYVMMIRHHMPSYDVINGCLAPRASNLACQTHLNTSFSPRVIANIQAMSSYVAISKL